MSWLRYAARRCAYLIGALLAAVWTVAAMESLTRPLYDLGKPVTGDVLIMLAAKLPIGPETIMVLALLLVGLKLMVGMFLLAALFAAVYEKHTFGSTDDAMFDVALMVAALATIASSVPGVIHGGELLLASIGELMLCALASALAIYGRGYLVRQAPRPARAYDLPVVQSRAA